MGLLFAGSNHGISHWLSAVINKVDNKSKAYFMDSIGLDISKYTKLKEHLERLMKYNNYSEFMDALANHFQSHLIMIYQNAIDDIISNGIKNKIDLIDKINGYSEHIYDRIVLSVEFMFDDINEWIYSNNYIKLLDWIKNIEYIDINYRFDDLFEKNKSYINKKELKEKLQEIKSGHSNFSFEIVNKKL